MKHFLFAAALVLFASCFSKSEIDPNSIGSQILINHRPYTFTANLSSEVTTFLKEKLDLKSKDPFISNLEDFKQLVNDEKNILILAEAYAGYTFFHDSNYKEVSIPESTASKLFLLENKQNISNSTIGVLVTDIDLINNIESINLPFVFDTNLEATSYAIISDISQANAYKFIAVDENFLKVKALADNFEVEAKSDKLLKNRWLVSKVLIDMLDDNESLQKFESILTKYSFEFLNTKKQKALDVASKPEHTSLKN